jgi:hypothetical protein
MWAINELGVTLLFCACSVTEILVILLVAGSPTVRWTG